MKGQNITKTLLTERSIDVVDWSDNMNAFDLGNLAENLLALFISQHYAVDVVDNQEKIHVI